MKTRIISGIVGIAILFLVIYLGSPVYNLAVLALTLIGLYEYNKAVENIKSGEIPYLLNYLLAIGVGLASYTGRVGDFRYLLFIYIILSFIQFVINNEVKTKDLALSLLGGLYVVFLMSYLYVFADDFKIWYVFLIASASDIFAYFVGRFFGKHKLAPVLSPKKTVEGLLGGIAGAVISTMIFAKIFDPQNLIAMGVIAPFGAIVSVFGDIFASKIKRETGIKDYGNIMPGHGGVLDRFDSILFTAPFVSYCLGVLELLKYYRG